MRYPGMYSYVSKSNKILQILSEMLEFLETRRCRSIIIATVIQSWSHLLLADCSQKSYSKYYMLDRILENEFAHNDLDLQRRQSFSDG
jgi:hypothetical protein